VAPPASGEATRRPPPGVGRAAGTGPAAEARAAPARRALTASGQTWTRQRAAVVAVLRGTRRPLEPDDLHRLARRRVPRLSLTTVFRTLRLLREHGLLREWPASGGTGRPAFTYRAGRASRAHRADHAALVCRTCGRTADVESVHLPPLLHDLQQRYGFRPDGARLRLTARCDTCSGRAASPPARPSGTPSAGTA
jgi:Fe2+ or Zn2+ uptake regulation protein